LNLFCWTIGTDGRPLIFPADRRESARPVPVDPRNFAACVNAAAKLAGRGLLVTLPPDLLALDPEWQRTLSRAAHENPGAVFFYGDYVLRGGTDQLQKVRADIGDITEREDWGPVWAVKVEWLLESGGLDEEHHRAAFYDLLLKSWGRRAHVGAPLAVVPAPQEDAGQSALKDRLFFPGRGKLGGFSYLFMDPEDERHTEAVFYKFLHRQHAWLESERSATPPFMGGAGGVSSPRVSVVTPVFNRAAFIGKAIESVQRQTFTDWEYIIVDNGSTDQTREVVKSYAQQDPRIRLIENDRNIIALSLNLGVRAAKGKYISQLDSDDEYLPGTLETMVAELESHPTWGIAIGYYELMDEAGTVLPEFGVIRHLEYNRNNILRVDGAGAPRMWHRSVIMEFGGFDEKELGHYGEDYDLVLKCGEKYEVGRVHEVCYRYRRHPDNTDVKRDPEMKIRNKTTARLNALERRKKLNSSN
jgi:GT2 family glycosyltransferase